MRNLQLVLKLANKKTKDVHLNLYKICQLEENGVVIVRSIKSKFEKHRQLIPLEDAKENIKDREYQRISSALGYIQNELMRYAKKYDIVVELIGSANLMSKYIMRSDWHSTKDMIKIVTSIAEFYDSGIFSDLAEGVSTCISCL